MGDFYNDIVLPFLIVAGLIMISFWLPIAHHNYFSLDEYESVPLVDSNDFSFRAFEGKSVRPRNHPMGYRLPRKAKVGQYFSVRAVIDLENTSTASIRDAFDTKSNIEIEKVLIVDQLKMELSGAAFEVEPIRETQQILAPYTRAIWEWRVTPKKRGRQFLSLTVYGVKGESVISLKQIKRPIHLTNYGSKWIQALIDNILVILGIFLPVSGFTIREIFKARKSKKAPET